MASKGKVQPKIQAAGLWQKREALYWWGTRFISDMHAIYSQWNAFTTSHIQKEAINLGLSTSHYQKNDLSEMELSLMFKKMQTMTTGVENWKQHFIAWLMTYVCSVRPGSITVAPGYEQGTRPKLNITTTITDPHAQATNSPTPPVVPKTRLCALATWSSCTLRVVALDSRWSSSITKATAILTPEKWYKPNANFASCQLLVTNSNLTLPH